MKITNSSFGALKNLDLVPKSVKFSGLGFVLKNTCSFFAMVGVFVCSALQSSNEVC